MRLNLQVGLSILLMDGKDWSFFSLFEVDCVDVLHNWDVIVICCTC
jgi:hypothetical protein